MKKIQLILPILLLLFGCKNKDLIIQKANKNCGCYQEIKSSLNLSYYSDCDYRYPWDKWDIECNSDPYYLFGNASPRLIQSNKIFLSTKTIEIVNTSQTKVYEVLIQISNNRKISYLKYKIEPTEIVILGCDSNFKINYDINKAKEGDCAEAVYLSHLSKNKIEYNIHKITLISEY